MAAHKRVLSRRICKCGKTAKYEVFNTMNASYGEFCSPCADRLVKTLNLEDKTRG